MFLLNIAITEAMKIVVAKGKRPYVFNPNVDGADNEAVYRHFGSSKASITADLFNNIKSHSPVALISDSADDFHQFFFV